MYLQDVLLIGEETFLFGIVQPDACRPRADSPPQNILVKTKYSQGVGFPTAPPLRAIPAGEDLGPGTAPALWEERGEANGRLCPYSLLPQLSNGAK